MKKNNSILFLFFFFFLFGLLFFQADSVIAQEEDKVFMVFLYEKIEEIIDVRGKTEEEIRQVENEIGSQNCLFQRSNSNGFVYKLRPTIITSEKDLLEAMGAKSEIFLKYGQKCLLAAYRAANSQKMQLKANGLEEQSCLRIELVDTSNDGYFFGKGYDTSERGSEPDIRSDFWPCSRNWPDQNIRLSDVEAKYNKQLLDIDKSGIRINITGKKNLTSTVYHEYAHFLDSAVLYGRNPYGLDDVHYSNEVTNEVAAFIEGWAEYNEMIESRQKVNYFKRAAKILAIESQTEVGSYSHVACDSCDFSTLLKSEAYNANLLYKLSQKIGEDKITETFFDSNDNDFRDLNDFVKRLIELHPEDTNDICSVVDEVFLNTASEEQFFRMVGETEETKSYAKTRKIRVVKPIIIEDLLPGKYYNNKEFSKKGVISKFVSNVKENISKGIEKLRNAVDTIFDKIKSKFNKNEVISEAEETNETQETPEEEPCTVIKKKNPLHSNNKKVGPSSNPFSVIK